MVILFNAPLTVLSSAFDKANLFAEIFSTNLKGTVMQIEKALENDRLLVSKVS